MALVNKAIDDIGMTSLQWKMFFLNGFGYAVDSVRFSIKFLICINTWVLIYNAASS
jgi:hypothetical protein